MTATSDSSTPAAAGTDEGKPFVHPQALVETPDVGAGTRVWAFAHLLPGSVVGRDCNICDGVFIEGDAFVGDRVTVKCGVQLWSGVTLEDDVFVGPNATFTNDPFPRSRSYPANYPRTVVRRGASIGANATLLPGIVIGERAMVGAGSVVTRDVPSEAVVVGNPARIVGYVKDRSRGVFGTARVVELPVIADARGTLTFGQFADHLPFVPRRYYTIKDVPAGKVRGGHAHRRQHGFCVCLAGAFTMSIDDGRGVRSWRLDTPAKGLYMPPMEWRVLSDFTPDAVVLCLSSGEYDEAEYIRDYSEFTSLATHSD